MISPINVAQICEIVDPGCMQSHAVRQESHAALWMRPMSCEVKITFASAVRVASRVYAPYAEAPAKRAATGTRAERLSLALPSCVTTTRSALSVADLMALRAARRKTLPL